MRFVLLYIAFLSLNASAETYYIDDLVIETSSDASSSSCVSGSRHSILVTGSIGPDSTFAVGKLIDQREPCTDASGEVIFPIEVTLESGGGYLEDGYKLGKVFRDRGVTTIIPDNKMCASSCAVAFLGGKKRLLAAKGSILFHAPYLKQMQLEGKERITCDLPKEELQALNDYYSSMTSVEVGDRLFERTMWYCSAENGWTIKGSAAAELYGIATKSKAAYMLQVAIFSALKNADNFKNELSTKNYSSFTRLISTKGGELSYRVYVGPNNRKDMIQAYKAKIDDRYKTDAIVLVSKNGDIFNWSSWELEP